MPLTTGTTYKIINADTHNVLESDGAPQHSVLPMVFLMLLNLYYPLITSCQPQAMG